MFQAPANLIPLSEAVGDYANPERELVIANGSDNTSQIAINVVIRKKIKSRHLKKADKDARADRDGDDAQRGHCPPSRARATPSEAATRVDAASTTSAPSRVKAARRYFP